MKLLTLKGMIFIMLVLIFSLIIEHLIPNDFNEFRELRGYLRSDNTKIIFFGDSTIESIAETDIDNRTIAEFLGHYLEQKIGKISHAAYDLRVFEAFGDYICKSNYEKPNLIIITINLRSFSIMWDLYPGYQFEYEINTLKNRSKQEPPPYELWTRVDKLFKINELFGDQSTKDAAILEWENEVVYYKKEPIGVVADFLTSDPIAKEMIQSKYISSYLYDLKENHRKINSLKNIINKYEECSIPLLIYITPIDYELGTYYVGEDFNDILNKNVRTFFKSMEEYDAHIIDMSSMLDGSFFDHPNTPNEHLNQRGREVVASELNKFLVSNANDLDLE